MTVNEIIAAFKAMIKPYSDNPTELNAANFSFDTDEYVGYEKNKIMYKLKASVLWAKVMSSFGSASQVLYSNTASGLAAIDVQDAIDEVVVDIAANTADIADNAADIILKADEADLLAHEAEVLPHEFTLATIKYDYGFSVNAEGYPVMTYEEQV